MKIPKIIQWLKEPVQHCVFASHMGGVFEERPRWRGMLANFLEPVGAFLCVVGLLVAFAAFVLTWGSSK